MSQGTKSLYYNALKDAGHTFTKHYREYSTSELATLLEEHNIPLPADNEEVKQALIDNSARTLEPVKNKAPTSSDMGVMTGIVDDLEVLRIDEQGREWYQEEVRKPAYPKPRGRRLLRYNDTGTTTVTVEDGQFTETFELPGEGTKVSEARITLPSFQVGIYKDPRLPFKTYVYNNMEGFEWAAVNDYYGGADMVPPTVKTMYVSNMLCYDIRSVINAIRDEARALRLAGHNI